MGLVMLVFVGTVILGVPVAFVLGMAGLAHFISIGNPAFFNVLINRIFSGIDNIGLIAIPFFILAGEVMNAGGVTKRLVDFVREMMGHVRGGLAYSTIVMAAVLSAMLGSANAVASILGSVMVPEMVEDGYPDDFSASLVASSAILGPVIPPSVTFIFFSVITGVSVGGLFLAGIIPGVLLALGFVGNIAYYSRFKKQLPKRDVKFSVVKFIKTFARAIPALSVPFILIGGILSGIFTPSESGAVAVAAAFFASLFYGSFAFSKLPGIFYRSARISAGIFIIIGFGNILGWSFAIDGIPELVSGWIMGITNNSYVIIFIMIIALIILDFMMEATAVILIFAPVLMPVAMGIGMDPVHFGVIFCITMTIALVTPPVGMTLFVTSNVTGVSLNRMSTSVLPFAAVAMIITTVLAYLPSLVMLIPRLFL